VRRAKTGRALREDEREGGGGGGEIVSVKESLSCDEVGREAMEREIESSQRTRHNTHHGENEGE
jgi:hypothetical protein